MMTMKTTMVEEMANSTSMGKMNSFLFSPGATFLLNRNSTFNFKVKSYMRSEKESTKTTYTFYCAKSGQKDAGSYTYTF